MMMKSNKCPACGGRGEIEDSTALGFVRVVIGERVFLVRCAKDLIKLLEEGKRFWEWEEEIATLKKLVEAYKERETVKEDGIE